ncbi:N5-glutamine methyltransferase family protein [Candidatus Hepatobacter penaei]|uniref:N5-glutamine methyltransferase family protein n=1 Tax=Candidatus Hepatobacter penaei TaxID=1274402 RepID=UPI0012E04093|nr:HemK/PrmC family methyltransferase [Candidatus Hepatobacter penaei]
MTFSDLSPDRPLRDFLCHLRRHSVTIGNADEDTAHREVYHLALESLALDPLTYVSVQDRPLSSFPHHARFLRWAASYQQGMPLSRQVGERAFWNHTFVITPHTLDPRPETEGIIEAAQALFPAQTPLRMLELGTGSGCVLLSLLAHYPKAQGVGTDDCQHALDVTWLNAGRLGVHDRLQLYRGSWFSALTPPQPHVPTYPAGLTNTHANKGGSNRETSTDVPPKTAWLGGQKPTTPPRAPNDAPWFDCMVANPPYIQTDVIPTLPRSVSHFDPHQALDGGYDGLDAYRAIIPRAASFLAPQGALILEIGWDQKEPVLALSSRYFKTQDVYKDASGHDRIVVCRQAIRPFAHRVITHTSR